MDDMKMLNMVDGIQDGSLTVKGLTNIYKKMSKKNSQ